MSVTLNHGVRALIALACLVVLAAAQSPPPFEIKETFSYSACVAVASDGTLPDADQQVFMPAGSGFYVLDGSHAQPVKPTDPLISDYKVRARGLVRDIKWTDDKVWIAAGIAGLMSYHRDTFVQDLEFALDEAPPAAWSLDVVRVGTSDYVIVGSNDNEVGGNLYLVEIPQVGNPVVHDEIPLFAPVYAVAATMDLHEGNIITVLAGTACWSPEGCSSLRRYDVDVAAGSPVFGAPVAVWPPSPPCDTKAFIRDILIDETPTGGHVAYVAAYTAGIRAFDLDTGGLHEMTGGGWPIIGPNGEPSGVYRYMSLSLYEPDNVLAAALGPAFPAERQYWGALNVPKSCDDVITGSSIEGIALFDLDQSPVNQHDGLISGRTLSKEPLALAVRPRAGGTFFIDAALGAHGLRVVKAQPSPNGWSLSVVGKWNQGNQPPLEKAPGGSFDDVLVLGGRLYVGTESGLLTFNDLSSATALREYSEFSNPGAILEV